MTTDDLVYTGKILWCLFYDTIATDFDSWIKINWIPEFYIWPFC